MTTNPFIPPAATDFFVVSVSVSSSTSAKAAGVGPFRGLYFKASASVVSIISNNGNNLTFSDPNGGGNASQGFIWMQGAFVSAITTATAQYGLI